MKFAIVDGLLSEARPKSRGQCRDCNAVMIAKCGDHKIWHWSHFRIANCDHWWEPETQWHRNWKNEFPEQCQEIRHCAPDGEVHRADVKTEKGTVLEFQYSAISPKERVSRELFYKPMIWVVSGTRFKRDLPSFQKALKSALPVDLAPLKLLLPIKVCSIVERWEGSLCPVYVDFGEPVLWRLKFTKQGNRVITIPVSRRSFIDHHRDNGRLKGYELPRPKAPIVRQSGLPRFDHYLRVQEARRRGRFERF